MTIAEFDRVNIQELAWEIAQAKADKHPENWEKDDGDSSLRRTIVAAMNLHGWPTDGVPGLIPLILKMLADGEIEAFSTFNELRCIEFELVKANPANWFISGEDANRVRYAMGLDQFTVKDINGIGTMNRNEFERFQTALEGRRAEGRYTLGEAAIFIHEATGTRADEIQSKLIDAALSGALLVYEPTQNARYQYGGAYATRPRNFYEEAYYSDLNRWLTENEPRLICKFPKPEATTDTVSDAPKGVIPEQRHDALTTELYPILESMPNVTPSLAMAELRKQIGRPNTCILKNMGDGVEWENDAGNVKTLKVSALKERIKVWKGKANSRIKEG